MSDFAGTEYEFAAGSLFGLRGWDMDEFGRLHGVTHKEVWLPGENVSKCNARTKITPCPGPTRSVVKIPKFDHKKTWFSRGAHDSIDLTPESLYSLETQYESCRHPRCDGYQHADEADQKHNFDPACQCGFWAYDEAGFKPHGAVVGVIEAFGKTTIGTKGFRAEKARIVGLCKVGADGKLLSRSVAARLSVLYPDALWCDDMDQMVSVFDGVLRSWAEVGEDFWTKPVAVKYDEYQSGFLRYVTGGVLSPSSYRMLGGGI